MFETETFLTKQITEQCTYFIRSRTTFIVKDAFFEICFAEAVKKG